MGAGSWFGEGRVWYRMVCGALRRRVGIAVVDVQAEVVIAAVDAAAVVVQPRRRKAQGHCVGQGSLGARMAVEGIEVLLSG